MKRLAVTTITVLALALIPLAGTHADDENSADGYSGYGWGGRGGGYGMMGGGQGGMMGGGMMGGGGYGGMMGGGMMGPRMLPFYNDLTPEQRQQLDTLHLGVAQQMLVEGAKVSGLMLALSQTMHKFPADKAEASKTFADIQKAQSNMFQLMQGAMASMQQIIGKERWAELEAFHSGRMQGNWGRGPGQPGPGGMHGRYGQR
ncbi:MAG: periplasmic heavy metal sensor [Candidatus Lambdaproteobacteria bacterium]|nr:periplasmic heavy metal sensor [Candidatus Lambdaproteobacteria bacterium]